MRHFCLTLAVSAIALFAQNADTPVDVRGWMDRGQEALKTANYAGASAAFQHAVELDGSNVSARLALAESLAAQPGFSGDNVFPRARVEFDQVLTQEPRNREALEGLAAIATEITAGPSPVEEKALDNAVAVYKEALALDLRNKRAWYSLALVDWIRWHPKWLEAVKHDRAKKAGVPLQDNDVRQTLKATSGWLLEDGIANLQKALNIDPMFSGANGYMGVFIRERAMIADTIKQYRRDLGVADEWERKSHVVRMRADLKTLECKMTPLLTPLYPPQLKQAGIQGTVRFEAIIGVDGHVRDLQLVSGDPSLIDAARSAAQRFVCKTTRLSGQPVEMETVLDVNFALTQ